MSLAWQCCDSQTCYQGAEIDYCMNVTKTEKPLNATKVRKLITNNILCGVTKTWHRISNSIELPGDIKWMCGLCSIRWMWIRTFVIWLIKPDIFTDSNSSKSNWMPAKHITIDMKILYIDCISPLLRSLYNNLLTQTSPFCKNIFNSFTSYRCMWHKTERLEKKIPLIFLNFDSS